MTTAKLSTKYQIVIPKTIRQQLGLAAGAAVTLYPLDAEHALLVKKPTNSVRALKGLGKKLWQELGGTETYLRKERRAWQKS